MLGERGCRCCKTIRWHLGFPKQLARRSEESFVQSNTHLMSPLYRLRGTAPHWRRCSSHKTSIQTFWMCSTNLLPWGCEKTPPHISLIFVPFNLQTIFWPPYICLRFYCIWMNEAPEGYHWQNCNINLVEPKNQVWASECLTITRFWIFLHKDIQCTWKNSHNECFASLLYINSTGSYRAKMGRKFFVGGNWKMNGTKAEIDTICSWLTAGPLDPNCEVI